MVNWSKMFLILFLSAIIPASLVLWVINVFVYTFHSAEGAWEPISPSRWFLAFAAPLYIAKTAFKRNSLNKSGAIAAVVVGFVMTLSNYCFFSSLLTFFIAGSRATKYKAERKHKLEANYKEGGQRDWKQVVCNGGIATQLAIMFMLEVGCGEPPINFRAHYTESWVCLAVLGALACSAGDTFSSEIGSVVGDSNPLLITSLSPVPKGTNGGVSLAGTIASVIGGGLVGAAYHATLVLLGNIDVLMECPPQWPLILIGGLAGLMGSMVDSFLGATLQYSGFDEERKCIVETLGESVKHISGSAVLDNHSVNLLASLITALITPQLGMAIWAIYT